MSEIRLDGRVALVTGGGRGLGRAHSLALASRGARVVVNDLDPGDGSPPPADAVAGEIRDAGGEALGNGESVDSPEGASRMVRAALDAFGRLDILVANAGVFAGAPYEQVSPKDFDWHLDVHLKGSFHVSQAAYRAMRAQRFGRVIFTTSASGLYGNPEQAAYAAAKAGILGLMNSLGIDGESHGVRANAISPYARTRMTEDMLTPSLAARLRPEQVAPVVVYLASEQCDVNRTVFAVGGGSVSRTFVGTTFGWRCEKGALLRPEDMRDHLGEILGTARFSLPTSVDTEAAALIGPRPR